LPQRFSFPVVRESHGCDICIGILGQQLFEVINQRVARVKRVQPIDKVTQEELGMFNGDLKKKTDG
jgi:hypothetical protein